MALIIDPVLFRSVAEGQLCLSAALAVNLLSVSDMRRSGIAAACAAFARCAFFKF